MTVRNIILASAFIAMGSTLQAENSDRAVGTPQGALSVSELGAAVYSLKFEVPDGGPLTPEVGLCYNSQMIGYGLAGYGVSITGISAITRGGKDLFHDGTLQGVTYTDSDTYFLDGKRLIPESDSTYTVEGDPYTKVKYYSNASPYPHFLVITDKGISYQYGNTENSRLSYTNKKGQQHTAAWYLNKVQDQYTNYVNYYYHAPTDMTVRPSSITYGFNARKSRGITNRIDFNYNSLGANARNFYIEDTHGETGYYLASVTASSNGNLYRKYTLNYAHSLDQSTRKWTRLTSVTEENGQGEQLNPVVF
ncbi:MAG: hypothetical protein IJP70_09865, partial [Bacteroidales bacterium]|nr:hypothetical protein [Bacteroidales bacterium]